jgi:predicted ribosome quality control (RQC) complex YloA/Tae2 family protein
VEKSEGDRVVRLIFQGRDEIGEPFKKTLVAQLTGRAANLFLLDENGFVRDSLRHFTGAGQEIGGLYQPPPALSGAKAKEPAFIAQPGQSVSQAADEYYSAFAEKQRREARLAAARKQVRADIKRRENMILRLQRELAAHGEPERHKWLGDVLLANLASARREGNRVALTDYFAPDTPQIEVEVDENLSLQEAAARAFARYGKAKRGAVEIARRAALLKEELAGLQARLEALETAAPQEFDAGASRPPERSETAGKRTKPLAGVREYISTDGLQILVGKTAKDNDNLTFRLARPHDFWFHAADYPGSHVVARNPGRGDIPRRTIVEAAQLAAQYSQAKDAGKVDVRFTQRKFLSKPKGAAPGLVRLSQYKTLTVAPAETARRVTANSF